jgi:hypothetical protein
MKTNSWTISLDDAEKELLGKIELDAHAIKGQEHYAENGKNVVALIDRLKKRKAIPKHRIQWFTDPECNIGGHGKSYLEAFEYNMQGGDVRTHPHFLKHLQYFIYGPDLPEAAMESFVADVKARGMITSGEVIPISKNAKALARDHGRTSKQDAEEFFKLALECGLSVSVATMVRKHVMSIR